MPTLQEQEEAAQRAAAIADQKRIIAQHEAHLRKSRERLEQLENDDFMKQSGHLKRSQMTVSQKSEVIRRKGLDAFLRVEP